MAEFKGDPMDNHNSDGDFEKIPYPGEEEARESVATHVDEVPKRPGSATSGKGVEKSGLKAGKALLEADVKVQEERNRKTSWSKSIDPRVLDLIYWRDVRKTGVVFALSLLLLTLLALFTVLSLVSYASILVLILAFSYRLYSKLSAYVRKSKEPHPLHKYLEKEISIPTESIHQLADQVVANVTKVIDDIRKLFLVDRFLDSIKFALLLWLMTFIGSWISGITLIAIGDIILFSCPKVYQVYQKQIDEFIALVNAKLESLLKLVQDKIQRKPKSA